MQTCEGFDPQWASAPGETVQDCLLRTGVSREGLAKNLGSSLEKVEQLIEGSLPIDAQIAEVLHRSLGGSINFWINRENQYQDDLIRLGVRRDPASALRWLRELPVRDMVEFGWVLRAGDALNQARECLRFFNVRSVEDWRAQYGAFEHAVAFRSSTAFGARPGAVAAWLRRGELEAESFDCKPWRADLFEAKLTSMRALSRNKRPERFVPELRRICAECGVAFVLAPAPSGCRASGATRFISPEKALLLLSLRHGSDDHFWFTLFHEAGHLLLHDPKALFVEAPELVSTHEEEEASAFAADVLIPPSKRENMLALDQTSKAIVRFACQAGVSPGIIVGQLQHYGRLAPNQMNFLKRRFTWRDGVCINRGRGHIARDFSASYR